jgi:hypothetical protein
MISCIRSTTRGASKFSDDGPPTDAILRMATTSTLPMSSSYITSCGQPDEACFTPEDVFNAHNSHHWAWGNPRAMHERGYQVRFSFRDWAGTIRDIALGSCLQYDRLTAQRYCDFLETVLPGLPEDVPLAVRQRLWLQNDGAPAHCGEDVRQWLNATHPEGGVDIECQLYDLCHRV